MSPKPCSRRSPFSPNTASINTQCLSIPQFFNFLSTTVIFYPETTCSEFVRRTGRSRLCLWQHCALKHCTLWKRTANKDHKAWPSGRGGWGAGGGGSGHSAAPPENESNTGTQSQILEGAKGHLVHAELQMARCQEIADKDNCALLVQNWKSPKHS